MEAMRGTIRPRLSGGEARRDMNGPVGLRDDGFDFSDEGSCALLEIREEGLEGFDKCLDKSMSEGFDCLVDLLQSKDQVVIRHEVARPLHA